MDSSLDNIYIETNKASLLEILRFLEINDLNFDPRISKTIELTEYAKKLYNNAKKIEAWNKNSLIGLIAIYLNDNNTKTGYITHVSINDIYMKHGLASTLLQVTIIHATILHFKNIKREVSKTNLSTIHLYTKIGFTKIESLKDTLIMNFEILLGL